jgi:hypothetical protein
MPHRSKLFVRLRVAFLAIGLFLVLPTVWVSADEAPNHPVNPILPPLQQKYGNKLDVQPVELKDAQDMDRLYQLGSCLSVSKENVGVPFIV